jgi:hypothetical protein
MLNFVEAHSNVDAVVLLSAIFAVTLYRNRKSVR